jgi:uncharacterized membrane protein
VEFDAFDGTVQSIESKDFGSQLKPTGGTTDILGAIQQASRGAGAAGGRKLSGVVLISDGADKAQLSKGFDRGSASQLEKLRVPISTIVLGSDEIRDLAIEDVSANDFAFVRNTIEVTARLRASGYHDMEIPVVLKKEGRVVATQILKIGEGGGYTVVFSFAPEQTGHFVYTIEAPALVGEAVIANNAAAFLLKVIRDRVRILLVVGKPSWDERFLRERLKRDPNIDLVSFYILRRPGDNPRVASDDELSLIPFPVRDVFQEQLRTFDLIIFQNFAYDETSYQMTQYLGGIADYVSEGGAIVMVGGENSFGEGRYDSTPLQAVLPVEVTETPPNTERFRARLTSDGRRHPVAMVAATGEESARAWAGLPELEGVHLTRPKPGSRVLLDHPFLTAEGSSVPVVVLGEYGRGRVIAVLTDSTWNWSFGESMEGEGERVYDRFWGNAIRWLVRDRELTQVRVAAADESPRLGEAIVIRASAKLQDFSAAAGAQIDVDLVRSDSGEAVAHGRANAGDDGEARIEFDPPDPGAYKLVARASRGGVPLGEAQDVVAVRAVDPELADAAPRPEVLRQIAELTGGTYVKAPRKLPIIPLVDPETVEVGRRKDAPLWDRWWALAVLAAVLSAEWILRRRWGEA